MPVDHNLVDNKAMDLESIKNIKNKLEWQEVPQIIAKMSK